MRHLRETLLAAALLAAFGVLQAFVGARELDRLTPTTALPALPLSSRLAALGLALMVATYLALGRALVSRGASTVEAFGLGALAGFIAGGVAGVAQALLQATFFRDVLLWSSLSDAYLPLVLAVVVVVEPLAGAVFGAVATWLGSALFRPAPRASAG